MNRYFIVSLLDINLQELESIIVSSIDTQRKNNDSSKMLVKLPFGDESNHQILSDSLEYTHEQILIELLKDEWND